MRERVTSPSFTEKPAQVNEPELSAKVKESSTPCCQRGMTKGELVQRSLEMLPL